MSLKAYEHWVRSESAARKYVSQKCRILRHIICPRCRTRKHYKLADQRYRCKQCRLIFNEFTGRWTGQLNINCVDWLRIVKLFELDLSAHKTARQVELSYPTVLKAYDIIRKSIISAGQDRDLLLSGEVEMDESYFGGRRKGKRGRGAAAKVPVFGILERNGIVRVEVVKNVTAKSLLSLAVKTVRRGSIVYTDKYKSYDSLMFCGYRHLKIDHGKKYVNGKVYINGLEGFWSYAKERLIKFHGVSPNKFPLYLKEMEFRFNHRKNHDLFPLLIKHLTDFGPNLL